MHSSTLILLVAEGLAGIAVLALLRFEILLRVKPDEYLVLTRIKKGTERHRVLTDGMFVRSPWEKIRGHVYRGVQTLKWQRDASVVIKTCDECWYCEHQLELDVVAYVVSIRFVLIDNRAIARRIVLGELDPTGHMQTCVDETIIRPGQVPLDPQEAALALEQRLRRDDRFHGFEVVRVVAWVPKESR